MIKRNISLILLLFLLSLFMSCESSYKEVEKVSVEYNSNNSYAGSINLTLLNGYDSFLLKYDLFTENCSVEAQFEGKDELLVKDIKLTGSEICVSPDADKTVYELDGLWTMSVNIDLGRCIREWKELANKAGGQNLSFFLTTVGKESGVKKDYAFKVSSRNLLRFIESIELVNPDGFSSNFS
ncbi:hypothetical protein [Borrelia sp. P9F1]|uniref:hypothetical protein n=1 Tax=Borrelia sp. P9F1 TaxID=3058374 RepID=UPI00264994EC|nr:hypothetical protein [Borrelia sp. P9F1]WKC58691.1 hypothetical protein QYZ68_05665 [Borrelia sp. P9F1]